MKDTLIINLADINESGKEFDFSINGDKALDEQLNSVIDDLKSYQVHLKLMRAGHIFIASGNYTLQKGDLCSLCGEDIVDNAKNKFNEYLVVEEKSKQQEGHAPHSGLNYETDQETYFIESLEFDVFEFLREVIASSLPMYPKCEDTVKCEKTRSSLQNKMEETSKKGMSPFSVLESLKNKKN